MTAITFEFSTSLHLSNYINALNVYRVVTSYY